MEEQKNPKRKGVYQRVESDWLGRTKITQRTGDASDDSEDDGAANDQWYKKPIGIVSLAVTGALIVYGITRALDHFVGKLN